MSNRYGWPVDSDRIVDILWQKDPDFVDFAKHILGVDNPRDAWEALYLPGGISKMSPTPADVHMTGPIKVLKSTGRRKKQDVEKMDLFKIGEMAIPGMRSSGHAARKGIRRQIRTTRQNIKTAATPEQKANYQAALGSQRQQLRQTPWRSRTTPFNPGRPAPPVQPPRPAVVSGPQNPAGPSVPAASGAPAQAKKPVGKFKRIAITGGAATATGAALYGAGKYGQSKKQKTGWPPPPQEEFGYSEDWVRTVPIIKADDKQQVFGWASIIEKNGERVLDKQGDIIEPDEMENSAYRFVIESRKGGRQHRRNEDDTPLQVSDMIESFALTKEKKEAMGLPSHVPTGWWVGFKVNDPDTWQAVKSGEVTSFSIHGRGRRSPIGGSTDDGR